MIPTLAVAVMMSPPVAYAQQVTAAIQTAPGPRSSSWQIQTMKVAIWPEYDDPRVFITYRGKLPPEVVPPANVRFLVPQGAEVTHTCGLTPTGEHQCRLPSFAPQGNQLEVSYAVPTQEFLIQK